MKNVGIGIVIFPFAWDCGAWRNGRAWVCQFGPIGFVVSGLAALGE